MTRLGIASAEKIALIRGSGVSLIEYLPTPEPEGIPLVILPSRLLWEKGVGEFVAAARRLRGEGVEARFALVGDTNPSNPRALPESQINEWTCEGVVEWWGRRSDRHHEFAQFERDRELQQVSPGETPARASSPRLREIGPHDTLLAQVDQSVLRLSNETRDLGEGPDPIGSHGDTYYLSFQ